MKPFNFSDTPDRRGTGSVKWDRYGGRDVLPLWVADMDFAVPAAVTEALQQRVEHAVFGYTHASEALVEALCDWVREHYRWTVEAEWLVWVPGAVPALNAACRMLEPGQGVVTTTPIYPPFLAAPKNMQRELLCAPMTGGTDEPAQMDLDAIQRALQGHGRMLFLCNPHNPLGRAFSREELMALGERVLAHDALVIADELHADLILEPGVRHQPFAGLSAELAARTITLLAPSKTFNIAGLGLSCAVIPDPGLRRRFRQTIDGILPYVNALGHVAGEAAWRHGHAWLADLLAYLRGNRDRVTTVLQQVPCIKARPPEATYLYWLDLRACGLPDPVKHLEQHGLGLSDGSDFGAPGFARLNFACPRATLDAALARLKAALA